MLNFCLYIGGLLKEHDVNKGFLKVMIVIIGLQSMATLPLDCIPLHNDAHDQEEVQGIQVDPEHDEGLVDQAGQQEEDRTTQIELNAPLVDFKIISDNRFVEVIEAILGFSVVFFVMYKVFWTKNDSNK